ncbi:hypothetical protein QJS10_CPB20g01211 [Acorus calamus]|uniref:Transmembrane protein n=1 Tax=Acorus calamus TaxID=4465 RepID=A0AAV9C8L0_ACOCL|nr:hypothetical protein QJS10_CPB20g01211 [Acorus calamus]
MSFRFFSIKYKKLKISPSLSHSLSFSSTAMQRQSFGTPSSKQLLQMDGDDEKRRRSSPVGGGVVEDEEEEIKAEKFDRSATARVERTVHLIPLLVLLCFLILYLRSYDPDSPKSPIVGDSLVRKSSTAEEERLFETTKGGIGDALAISGHRSLHQLGRRGGRRNRKIGFR